MTNENNEDGLTVERLLRSVEQDSSFHPPNRIEVREEMLRRFDCADVTPPDLISVAPVSEANGSFRVAVFRIAAGLVVIAGLTAVGLLAGANEENRGLDVGTQQPTQSDGAERRSFFEGGLSFDVDGGLEVTDFGNRVLISRANGGSTAADAIVVLELTNNDAVRRFEELNSRGLATSRQSRIEVDRIAATRWIVGLTQLGAAQLECVSDPVCFEVVEGQPSTAVSGSTQASVTEIPVDPVRTYLFVTDDDGPLRSTLAAVIGTVEVN